MPHDQQSSRCHHRRQTVILLHIYRRRTMTFPQMKAIRKSFAYAYELTGGETPKGNFKRVGSIWPVVLESECIPVTSSQKPKRIPEPEELKEAFTSPWKPDHSWCLMEFLTGLVEAYDLFINGYRSREDIERVKKSVTHEFDWRNGWECTKLVGGRSKLSGPKKNTREWWIWRVCHCPSKRHIRVPRTFCMKIDEDGNPTVDQFAWCTLCPLAALELIWQHQEGMVDQQPRCYGKWLASGRFGTSSRGDVAKHAIAWLRVQGATNGTYDTNSGRKSLARWTSHLHILYPESFPVHGDLYDVWAKSYDTTVPRSGYSIRDQPRDPREACVALRKMARYLGAGRKLRVTLSRRERFNYNILKALGHKEKAERIRQGLPSSDEESSDEDDSIPSPPAPKPRSSAPLKRKRKRRSPPPPPKRKRRIVESDDDDSSMS